ncbi:hypothetical protein [Anaerococcus sp. AGMB09787]|uniref:hypothetical protein n=1 Tax=Anaerococcus sp. AGMB09787 TaxID=2922869 RepID=UPI001FAF0FF8|nr:hypothetical protein [Anaerococcus sp. AGMB09787]
MGKNIGGKHYMEVTLDKKEVLINKMMSLSINQDKSLLDIYVDNNFDELIDFEDFCNLIQYNTSPLDKSLIKDNTDVQCGIKIGSLYLNV